MDDLTHIVLTLRGGNWERLQTLVTQPDPVHQSGGFQDRKKKWRLTLNIASKSIELDANDIEWIRRHIANRDNGGWQKKIADIFAGQHPAFSRIARLPRKKPEERRHRSPNAPGLSDDIRLC